MIPTRIPQSGVGASPKPTSPPRTHSTSTTACLLGLWLLVALSTASVSAAANTPQPPPEPLTTVLDVERPTTTDLLKLATAQEPLRARVLNPSFPFLTAYGTLTFQPSMLAGLDLDRTTRGFDTLITINSNRLTGFLMLPAFSLENPDGTRTEVRRETVRRLAFRRRDDELHGLSQGSWIRLRNGDALSGQWPTNAPADQDLPLVLDLGLGLNLYPDWIAGRGDSLEAATSARATALRPPRPLLPTTKPSLVAPTNFDSMLWIPPGTYTLGSPNDELGRDPDEGPQTQVTIPHGFWIAQCEVTQTEYQIVMGDNPSIATGHPTHPVEKISWQEALEYCGRLTRLAEEADRLPEGHIYRLPTEAEWEYACRAGTTTRFSFGDDRAATQLAEFAWFTGNSDSMTHPVGTRKPNPWGLFDMHGNVWEWCLDRFEGQLPGGSITNRPVAAEGTLRTARGGSWLYEPKACRSANRDDYSPSNRCSDVGFRVVLGRLHAEESAP